MLELIVFAVNPRVRPVTPHPPPVPRKGLASPKCWVEWEGKAGAFRINGNVPHFLLQPFWPMGTGCARGFLAAFDTAWMVKSWDQGTPPLELLAER